MDGKDADAVKRQVTGTCDSLHAVGRSGTDAYDSIHPVKKEQKTKDPSAANVILITLVIFTFFGIICTALYLSGFFGAWADGPIDYDLLANLPDEGMESLFYVSAGEDAFAEVSSLAGELIGGGLLKEITKAKIGYAQYKGGASCYVVYLESDESISGLADKLGTYLNPWLSASSDKLSIEKKNGKGMDYYLIDRPGSYSPPVCAWQQGRGIVLLYYGSGYSQNEKTDCSSLVGRKTSKERFEKILVPVDSIREDLKIEEKPYAQVWCWNGVQGYQASVKSAYGMAYSDDNGIYLFAAGSGLDSVQISGQRLCQGGRIIKSSGKEACFKDSQASGLSYASLSSPLSYERAVGEYTLYAYAYPKTQDKEFVKQRAERFIYSAAFAGTEKTWTDKRTVNIQVEDDAGSPLAGARLTVYKNYNTTVSEALTDLSGNASFKDLPLEYFYVKAEKDGYYPENGYLYSTYTEETITLSKKYTTAIASKPKCGNYLCESGENCRTCPVDCLCKGVCVNGTCRNIPYSIELPSVKNRSWNVSYAPVGEKIKVQSDNCFYLDVLSFSGEEIEPYDADVDKCISAHGVRYNATGPGAAPWFNWGGCAGTKYFEVEAGKPIILRVYTESCPGCVCYHPQFNVYDTVGGVWVKYQNESG